MEVSNHQAQQTANQLVNVDTRIHSQGTKTAQRKENNSPMLKQKQVKQNQKEAIRNQIRKTKREQHKIVQVSNPDATVTIKTETKRHSNPTTKDSMSSTEE